MWFISQHYYNHHPHVFGYLWNLENSQVKTVVKKKDSSKALPKIQEKKVKLKKDGATEKQSNYITSTSIDQEICIHIA